MNNKEFNFGISYAALGSLWWGILGVIYFEYISFIGHFESVIHRCIWTSLFLLITTIYFSKWKIFFEVINNKKNLITLFFSGFLYIQISILKLHPQFDPSFLNKNY